jgi:hypothetical protein
MNRMPITGGAPSIPSKLSYRELLERPEIVVVEWRFRDLPTSGTIAPLPLVKRLTGLGYRNTHSFCGGLVRRGETFWNGIAI